MGALVDRRAMPTSWAEHVGDVKAVAEVVLWGRWAWESSS